MAKVGIAVVAIVSAGLTGAFSSWLVVRWRERVDRRKALSRKGDIRDGWMDDLGASGVELSILSYLGNLGRRLTHRVTIRMVPGRLGGGPRFAEATEAMLKYAGISDNVTVDAIREGRVRLAFVGGAVGAVVGACLSNELALLLGVLGVAAGFAAPRFAIRRVKEQRSAACRRELPELLEVVSLGLRSGLTFDRSFQLYVTHFDTGLSRSCEIALQKWSMGLADREEALKELSASYDSDSLRRVVDTIVRSMRFGTSLAQELEKAASDAQSEYKSMRQEEVAKAPVRMMIPTATLILPAMLLLVLGPVLLELIEGF